MRTFEVALSEKYLGVIEVEAGSEEEAERKVRAMIRGTGEEDIPYGVMNESEGYVIEAVREVPQSD